MKRLASLALSGIILQFASAGALACTVGATSLNFTSIDPIANVDSTSTATVTVDCSDMGAATPFSVSLTQGASGNFMPRAMTGAKGTLQYNLYLDSAHSQIWGDGLSGTVTWNASTAGAVQHTVFGRVPSQPSAYPGVYTDNITVTVQF